MFTGRDLLVFDKYRSAGSHAFSSDAVSDTDKDIYQAIFSALTDAAHQAIQPEPFVNWFRTWHVRFGRDGGVQGHRPVDLWASVINREPEAFGRFPQIYAIASGAGLEIGFSVAIHESDYYNLSVKQQNREIIPLLYGKLPTANSAFVTDLDGQLSEQGGWQFGMKARQGPKGDFSSLADLVRFLKSSESASKGGGAIYRIIAPDALTPDFDLTKALSDSVVLFAPLMRLLTPSAPEQVRLSDIEFIREAAEKITPFDPTDLDDGRRKVLRQIAVRQGQSKFREKLLDAYDFRCAITGTAIPATLQAAHILPYKGPETNSVQNGLLLRADIHNLFDLGLIEIDPDTLVISIADELRATAFRKLDGRTLRRPKSHHHMPSREALQLRRHLFHLAASGTDLERTPSSPQQIEGERVSGLGALVGTRN